MQISTGSSKIISALENYGCGLNRILNILNNQI